MISVCMPTFNGEKYIKQQIDSILKQIGKYDEIIISDDSSTDNTIQIIKEYNDSRILLLENCQFKSPIFNLENALKEAKGDYIFLSDQDDLWLDNKVEKTMKLLEGYNLVVSDCLIMNMNEKNETKSFFKSVNAHNGFFHNLLKNGYLGCCMAFNRNLLSFFLPFPKKIAMHDIWMGLMSEIVTTPYFFNEPLIIYRKHDTNATPFTSGVSQNSYLYRIKYRIETVCLIILRVLKIKMNFKRNGN